MKVSLKLELSCTAHWLNLQHLKLCEWLRMTASLVFEWMIRVDLFRFGSSRLVSFRFLSSRLVSQLVSILFESLKRKLKSFALVSGRSLSY